MKLGTNDIGSVYLGTNAVQKVYLGTNQVWTSFTGLLDTYTGAAAAYSLRRLSGSYTGSAIRVRRASDNTEQDIGFVNNVLDTSALTTFCSGTDGFVKTWYDQSGNSRDLNQNTAANQPQIVSGGSVILKNGKPAISCDDLNDRLQQNFNLVKPFSIFTSFSQNSILNSRMIGTIDLNSFISARSGGGSVLVGGFVVNAAYGSDDTLLLGSLLNNNSTTNYFYNGTDITTASRNNDFGTFSIGSTYSQHPNGKIVELIVYSSDQSSNRTGIETNINTYYSIY